MKYLVVLEFCVFIFILTLTQSIAISPLRKFGIPYSLIRLFATSFLMITSGAVYYINPFFYKIGSPFVISFFLVLIIEYVFFSLVIHFSDLFPRYNNTLKNKKYFLEIFILFIFTTMLMVIFLNIYKKEMFLSFGDFDDFVRLTYFITTYEQQFFSLTYSDIGLNEARVGLFYPYAGFIISSLITTLLDISFIDSTFYMILFISFYSYIFSMYVLIKILKIPNLYIMFIYLFLASIFPIGLIFTGNLSSIYGIIGAISCLILMILIGTSTRPTTFSIIVILLLILIIPLHPSAVFTFIFLLLAFNTIFKRFDLKDLRLINFDVLGILIGGILITFSIISFHFLEIKILLNAYQVLVGLKNSLPIRISLEDFFNESSLPPRILDYILTNVVSLSAWRWLIPTGLILWVIIIYSYFKFNKSISYFFPLVFYLFLVFSSATSGIQGFRLISFLTVPYYQSPARIFHIGVLLYFFYLGRFLLDKRERASS